MRFANPAALWLALLALPIIALHILKPRRIQQTVSSILHWAGIASPVTSSKPWQRLKPSWLLLAQVLTAILLAVALAKPVQLTSLPLADHTIFVIDASSSMQSVDGEPSRFDSAVDRAAELRKQVPGSGEASLIVAGDQARALVSRSTDSRAFNQALDNLEPYDGEADFAGAFTMAAGLNSAETPTRVVFISDGGIAADDLRVAPEGARYEKVGTGDTNRGISQLTVEPSKEGLIGRVSVKNFGGPESTNQLRIDVDGITVNRQDVTVPAGEVVNLSVRLPQGERIEAFLDSDDLYDLDDRAVATISRRPEISVLRVGGPNVFLDAALSAVAGVDVTQLAEFPATIDPSIDVVIADRVAVPANVDKPIWAIAAAGGLTTATGLATTSETVDITDTTVEGTDTDENNDSDPVSSVAAGGGSESGQESGEAIVQVKVVGETQSPQVTLVRGDSPLITGLELSDLLIARSQTIEVPIEAEVVLGAEGAPLLVKIDRPKGDVVYQSFAIDESNLGLAVEGFPVMVERILSDLGQAVTPPAKLPVGARLPYDPTIEATLTAPDRTSQKLAPGSAAPEASTVGFWQIEQPGRVPILVAVNPVSTESSVASAPEVAFARGFNESTGQGSQGEVSLLWIVVLILLAILLAEWLLARRQVGVTVRQWRVAQILRGLVALALILSLLNLSWSRKSDDVATIFIIDASDSMGNAGTTAASEFVRDALASKSEKDVAGVIAFGKDARIDSLVSSEPDFGRVSVEIDKTATDLASGLRLGAAAAPNDSRRRLVLISDGRATAGDIAEEAKRLAGEGLPVDVVAIDPPIGADVAVRSTEVPSVARLGESLTIKATIVSPVAQTVLVDLLRDGAEVESKSVALTAGDNTVEFTDVADESSVLRYQVAVSGQGDPVTENDRAYAAVPVIGAERVLLVDGASEGASGTNTATLRSSLQSSGLPVDTVKPADLPALDDLTQYASIIMVNVDNNDLSDSQVQDLSTAVRDLGRGMLIVGGSHSYALGGYRNSVFEDLLPVESEITDPLRRQSVAQVLAIDTSGSMGACHCNEDGENGLGNGNRLDGGVSKTDIARNASAKAIASLGANDEVGVLTMDNSDQWVIDLQSNPSKETIDTGLAKLEPDGPTFLGTGLDAAGDELAKSNASLKHVILFSDGFTDRRDLARLEAQAAQLVDAGVTVSVVATGEGAANDLKGIAEAGGGRFYPGKNLADIPDLIVQETILASRDFVNEGDFSPKVNAGSPVVGDLEVAPNLKGYIATTAKPTARVDMRIGPDEDPLLSSWRPGLGRVTAWTADGGERWAAPWVGWEGAPDFWAEVVKDTFPQNADGGGVQATVEGDQLNLRVESSSAWADDATAVARIGGPDGTSTEVTLERIDGSTFAATVPVDEEGIYAVGGSVTAGGENVWSGIGLSTRSYAAEYTPTPPNPDELERLAALTGGRNDVTALQVFDRTGTSPGSRQVLLSLWFLIFALAAWPIAVAVSRLAWRRGVVAAGPQRALATVSELRRRMPKLDRPNVEAQNKTRKPTSDSEIGSLKPGSSAPTGPANIDPSVFERLQKQAAKESKTKTGAESESGAKSGVTPNASDGEEPSGSTVNRLLAKKKDKDQ